MNQRIDGGIFTRYRYFFSRADGKEVEPEKHTLGLQYEILFAEPPGPSCTDKLTLYTQWNTFNKLR